MAESRAWSVVATDDRALSIRSYEDGDDLNGVFVVTDNTTAKDFLGEIHSLASNLRRGWRGALPRDVVIGLEQIERLAQQRYLWPARDGVEVL